MRFWPRFGCLRPILKILKDSYTPRLKPVVFDHWFDMFTDSRSMAVAIKFYFKFWQCQKIWCRVLQCDVSYDEHQTFFIFQDKPWSELILRCYCPPLMEFIWYVAFAMINTSCAAVFMWVSSAVYTFLLKYATIAAFHHILFMIAKISASRAMQLVRSYWMCMGW